MIGAIIGDTVGSRFEFHNTNTKDFEFLHDAQLEIIDSFRARYITGGVR